jgi:uncharacterized delta-60 repeat protein
MKPPFALPAVRRSASRANNPFRKAKQRAATRSMTLRITKLLVCAAVLISGATLLIKIVGVGAATLNGVDPTFNPGGSGAAFNPPAGSTPETIGTDSGIRAMVVQPDGKIIIGGNFHDYNGDPNVPNGIMRLNPDGTRDASFDPPLGGINGIAAFRVNSQVPASGVRALALQSDGKIIVGLDGHVIYDGAPIPFPPLIRLNSDGTVDGAFNATAIAGISFSSGGPLDRFASATVNALFVLPDGKILVGGRFSLYNYEQNTNIPTDVPDSLIRLNPDGTWDNTFNPDGSGFVSSTVLSINLFKTETGTATVNTLAVQPDGKILVGGEFSSYLSSRPTPFGPLTVTTNRRGIIRLFPDGRPDPFFGDDLNGFVLEPPLGDVPVRAIALQPDGKVLVAGDFSRWRFVETPDRITRLTPNGQPDNTFNAGGSGANGRVNAITLQPDGRLFIGGDFTDYNGIDVPDRVIRLKADGTRDAAFNPAGAGFDGSVEAIALQANATSPNQRILIGGQFANYNGADVPDKIMRLLPPTGAISFSSASYGVGETAGNAAIVLKRTSGADAEVVAKITATNVSTTSADYTFPAGGVSVTWPLGDSADKVVLIPIANDGVAEPNETLTLNLT